MGKKNIKADPKIQEMETLYEKGNFFLVRKQAKAYFADSLDSSKKSHERVAFFLKATGVDTWSLVGSGLIFVFICFISYLYMK